MRTPKYYRSLEDILLFCSLTSDCIVIAEINDITSKEEFVADLSCEFCSQIISLSELSMQEGDSFRGKIKDNTVVVIDEFINSCYQAEDVIANLNYNRDWLLSLYCKIIIIIPTVIVNQLIRYSNNFWSCVSLYRSFTIDYPCFITPHFIDEVTDRFESRDDHIRRRLVEKNIYKIRTSVAGITSRFFDTNITRITERELVDLLHVQLHQINPLRESDALKLFDRIFSASREFYIFGHYKYAVRCLEFLRVNFTLGINYRSMEIQLHEALAEAYFRIRDYSKSIHHYKNLIKDLKLDSIQEEDILASGPVPPEQAARLLNNIAVNMQSIGNTDDAYQLFSVAYRIAKKIPETVLYSEILYNMSIILYTEHRLEQSLEFINTAIYTVSDIQSRHYTILTAMYNVFRAYLLTSLGDVKAAARLLGQYLSFLRGEVYENNLYVLEAHYSFAFAYSRFGEFEKALHCIENAHRISKKIDCTTNVKTQICELTGEILYFKNEDSGLAIKYFKRLLAMNAKCGLFSCDIISWILSVMSD